jgi:hypothetical protein
MSLCRFLEAAKESRRPSDEKETELWLVIDERSLKKNFLSLLFISRPLQGDIIFEICKRGQLCDGYHTIPFPKFPGVMNQAETSRDCL